MSAVFSGYKSGDQCKVLTFQRFMVVKNTFLAIFWVSLIKKFISRRVFYVSEITTKHFFQDLNDEKSKVVHDTLQRQIQMYFQHRIIATPEGVSGLIEYIKGTDHMALKSVGIGSLEITLRCPSLGSLESLWSDYQCGHLNDVAERYLVTHDIKKELNLERIRLKTIIEEENYRFCKRILMAKSCEFESSL